MKKRMIKGVRVTMKYGKSLMLIIKRIKPGALLKRLIQVNLLILTTLGSVFTVFTGILAFQNVDSFNEWFNKEFETKQYWLSAANSLSPEVNVSFFDKRLGAPIYTATHNGLTNRTYINDYFYTQAMVADDGSVLLFSITTRKDDFHPKIPYLYNANSEPYLLGKTTFGDMTSRGWTNSDIASQYIPSFRRTIYSESYYFGNAGNYLYYFLSSNDAGGIGEEHAELERSRIKAFTFEDTGLFDDCSRDFLPVPGNLSGKSGPAVEEMKKAKERMSGAVANTITVTGRSGGVICEYQDFFKEQGVLILGPNLDKIRLFRDVD